MFTVDSINIASHTSALIVTGMLLIGVLLDGNLKERIYRSFFALILLNLIGILSEFAMVFLMMAGIPPSGTPIVLFDFLSYLTGPLQNIAFSLYLYEFISTKRNLSRTPFYLSMLLSVISVITLVLAQTRGLYGGFGEIYDYEQGEMSTVYFLTSALFLIVFIYIALRYGGGLRKRERMALLSYPLIALADYVIEGIFSKIWVAYLGVSLILFIIYINIHGELKQQLIRKDAELADQRIAIMLSQIQPHFLYNSLSSIAALCDVSPSEVKGAVESFAHYLRGNLESFDKRDLICFEDELLHLETYLSLEQLRFGDELQVRYDIELEDFMLPPLTVQPIVENAVKHGVMKKRGGGTVSVDVSRSGYIIRIIVADNGAGFDSRKLSENNSCHVGIKNVRNRLDAQCGGALEIESKSGEGTTATITIPYIPKEVPR